METKDINSSKDENQISFIELKGEATACGQTDGLKIEGIVYPVGIFYAHWRGPNWRDKLMDYFKTILWAVLYRPIIARVEFNLEDGRFRPVITPGILLAGNKYQRNMVR